MQRRNFVLAAISALFAPFLPAAQCPRPPPLLRVSTWLAVIRSTRFARAQQHVLQTLQIRRERGGVTADILEQLVP